MRNQKHRVKFLQKLSNVESNLTFHKKDLISFPIKMSFDYWWIKYILIRMVNSLHARGNPHWPLVSLLNKCSKCFAYQYFKLISFAFLRVTWFGLFFSSEISHCNQKHYIVLFCLFYGRCYLILQVIILLSKFLMLIQNF